MSPEQITSILNRLLSLAMVLATIIARRKAIKHSQRRKAGNAR